METLVRRCEAVSQSARDKPAPEDRARAGGSGDHRYGTGRWLSVQPLRLQGWGLRTVQWPLWVSVTIVATLIMRGSREALDQTTPPFVYILIVLGATAGGERWLGLL